MEAIGDDGRPRKVYAITEAGRERLHRLLMDTEKHLGEYDILFSLKVMLFWQLTAEERVRLARHYFVHAQHNIDHLEHEREDFDCGKVHLSAAEIEDIRTVIDHRLEYWRTERAWAEQLIEQQQQPDKEAI
jgi:DNA-binding PadR family transcriptional regulator